MAGAIVKTRSTLRVKMAVVLYIWFLSFAVGGMQRAAAQTWDTLGRIPSEAVLQRVQVSSTGAMYAYTVDENTESWRSLDGGKSWHLLLHQGPIALFKDGRVVVAERDAEDSTQSKILLSADDGFQWSKLIEGEYIMVYVGRDDRLYLRNDELIYRFDNDRLTRFNRFRNGVINMAAFQDNVVAHNYTALGWTAGDFAWRNNDQLRGSCGFEFVCGTALDSLYVIISSRHKGEQKWCRSTIKTNVGEAENWLEELPEGETWDIALFDALTAYAANSVLGVVRRDVDGIWFENSIDSPQCHDLFAAPDGALYALDSNNTVFRLPQADQPYKRLAFTGEIETSSLLNKTERDTVHILNSGIAATVIDSLRLGRGLNSPLRIVYEDMQLPFVLQPGNTLAVYLETMFTASDSSAITDSLTVYAGELRLSKTVLARANLPLVTPGQKWTGKLAPGREMRISLELKNRGTHPFRLDSVHFIVDPRLEYVRHDSVGFGSSSSSSSGPLPVTAGVNREVSYSIYVKPLVRDTISLFIRYYTDFGGLEQIVNVALPEFQVENRLPWSKEPIVLNPHASAPFSLLIFNNGNVDYNIDSVCLKSVPDILSVDAANLNHEKYLACDDMFPLLVRVRDSPDTTVSCTVILKTEFGEVEHSLSLEVKNAEVPQVADWTASPDLTNVSSLRYNGDGTKLGVYSDNQLTVLDVRDGVSVGTFRHNRIGETTLLTFLNKDYDVDISWDGRLVALGTAVKVNGENQAVLELMDIQTRKIIQTIPFNDLKQRIHSTRFLPGDSLLAVSFIASVNEPSRDWHEGKFGVYSLHSNSWKYLNEELPSASIDLAANGRYVQFQRYFYFHEWSGSHFDSKTHRFSTFLYDVESDELLDVPFKCCSAEFSDDGSRRIFRQRDQNTYDILQLVLQRNPIRFTELDYIGEKGAILPDGEHYAYLYYTGLRIAHLKSGGIVVGECFEHDVKLIDFAISPDGSKIAFVDVNGIVWQQDFECEFADIRTVDVDETDVNNDLSLRVFPNPTNSLLFVAHPHMSNGRVRILDMTGRESLSFTFSDKQESQVNVESLSPGVYCLEVSDGSQRASVLFVRR